MIRKLGTTHFNITASEPITKGNPDRIMLSENGADGNTIFFQRDEIKELIQLLKLADAEFKE